MQYYPFVLTTNFIDFVDGWLHLSIARASLALRSVRAAIDFVDGWLHLGIAQASLALLSVCAAIDEVNEEVATANSPYYFFIKNA